LTPRYCKRVYQTEPDPHGVFLTLLKIFLQPVSPTEPSLLKPALDLISRQSPRIDPIEALQLLPPLVTTADIRTFLHAALRIPRVDARIERELWLARSQQADRRVAALHTRRVRVTDSRMQVVSTTSNPYAHYFNADVHSVTNDSVIVWLQFICRGKHSRQDLAAPA
jgi:hypothetical protein